MDANRKLYPVLSPAKLAHVVLRTTNYDVMSKYYKQFLGAGIDFENDSACFLKYDEEHHRIGILKLGDMKGSARTAPGLEHIAFTFKSLNDLVTAWKQRRALGIEPVWCVNHGPTTSIYYEDPDGNKLETFVDNFDDIAAQVAFVTSEDFRDNPVGTDFDPAELAARVESGEPDELIKKRIEVGPREFPTTVGHFAADK